MKKMESLATAGAIKIDATAIDSDSLDVHVSGSSQLFLEGKRWIKRQLTLWDKGVLMSVV
ncbi:hypothetical protein [Candidatus Coxiella mudrowiae]|uniref:hypothetical protein n=1 Tax=Candidatus Coxiella mudrowiae TaxID=2054173 RepID=UPI001F2A7E48|nr:hypothetical protein [Candidatus Coxiella mudrowiae]